MSAVDPVRLNRAYQAARTALLAERAPEGHWVGELSTSALSTAVAVSALALVERAGHGSFAPLIAGGLAWLAAHQSSDGGWGDTVKSLSNVSTTMLCRAAFHITGTAEAHADCLRKSEAWLAERHGTTPEQIAERVRARYGRDRTFSVPILMTSALAGLVSWREVPALPFELACFPQSWFRFLRLPVVSYALPALIAIGQAVHHHRPARWPMRLVRRLAIGKSLRVLRKIQPSNGGFLEATPLTSFVAMGLASSGRADHPVTQLCVAFIRESVRPDGSWPIDTNLSTWVTTLAINALAAGGELDDLDMRSEVRNWLLRQQYRERHPFTGSDPGAFGWAPLPGALPDADDTPGALLALSHLRSADDPTPVHAFTRQTIRLIRFIDADPALVQVPMPASEMGAQVAHGLSWLLALQNRDGGWPTFCRGWGKLPFDRSGTDLTAHALRALHAWSAEVRSGWFSQAFSKALGVRAQSAGRSFSLPRTQAIEQATARGLAYLEREQRPDGSWLPLWFGNQHAPDDVNPAYGTARVLLAYRDLGLMTSRPAIRGARWLLANQNAQGGWGGMISVPSSVEETALAVEALLAAGAEAEGAVQRGLAWLIERIEAGGLAEPEPIGFYFAKLWYFEKMYPMVFAVSALGQARRKFGQGAK
jgi:squalene-hopene/tetraprenyl-beta-curcumene cyclase